MNQNMNTSLNQLNSTCINSLNNDSMDISLNNLSPSSKHSIFDDICDTTQLPRNSLNLALSTRFKEEIQKINQDKLSIYNHTDAFNTDHSIKLLKILNSQRENESMCDYEIIVNEESFYCHKCILIAMSDFFSVMLNGNLKI